MSAWKDEYKVRWPAWIRKNREYQENLKFVENCDRRLQRRGLFNQFMTFLYWTFVLGIGISVLWFIRNLIGC